MRERGKKIVTTSRRRDHVQTLRFGWETTTAIRHSLRDMCITIGIIPGTTGTEEQLTSSEVLL